MPLRWSWATKLFVLVALPLFLLITAGIVGLGWFYIFQDKFIFSPNVYDFSEDPIYVRGPSVFGVPADEVNIKTRDNVEIHGWLLKRPDAQKAPTFISFPGNYGYKGLRLGHATRLYELGANVLLVDYRGFGHSGGSPTEEGVYRDADAALDFILNSQDVNNKDIFVVGHSMGGAVAIDLASRRGSQITGLVVENTFTSLRDIAYDKFPELRYIRWVLELAQRCYMSNIDKVRTLTVPTFFLSGREDKQIPPSHTDRLFDACSAPLKWLERVENGGHESSHEMNIERWGDRMQSFIDEAKAAKVESLTKGEHLASKGSEEVDMTSTKLDAGDRKAGELQEKQALLAVPLMLCSLIMYAYLASMDRHKRKGNERNFMLVDVPVDTRGQQMDNAHRHNLSGHLRSWELEDNESEALSEHRTTPAVHAAAYTLVP